MTTAHGPEAMRLVDEALAIGRLVVPTPTVITVTGLALDVIAGKMDRDAAIDTLAYRRDLKRPTAARYLDLAVEALTATPED